MDSSLFKIDKLINLILLQDWMHRCVIGGLEDNKHGHKCVVSCANDNGAVWHLRHSNGPLQGTFWDVYPDDFHSPELALVMLSKSHAPPWTKTLSTHGRPTP